MIDKIHLRTEHFEAKYKHGTEKHKNLALTNLKIQKLFLNIQINAGCL